MYVSKPDFHKGERGWLAFAKGLLLYKSRDVGSGSMLTVVNTENLEEQQNFRLEGSTYSDYSLFQDTFISRIFSEQFCVIYYLEPMFSLQLFPFTPYTLCCMDLQEMVLVQMSCSVMESTLVMSLLRKTYVSGKIVG